MAKSTTEKKTITLRTEIVEKIEKQAQHENRNFSNMMETAAIRYLSKQVL